MQRFVLILTAIGLLGGIASAAAITYTITTTATGSLGGTTFTDASVTVTLTGNTSNVVFGPSPLNDFLVNPGSATIDISGLGAATFTDSIEVVSSFDTLVFGGASVVIIAQLDNPSGDSITGIVVEEDAALFGYNLQNPLGAVSGTGGAASGGNPSNIFPTTAGNLFLTSDFTTDAVPSTVTVTGGVPEPTSLILLGTGLLGLIGFRLRQPRR